MRFDSHTDFLGAFLCLREGETVRKVCIVSECPHREFLMCQSYLGLLHCFLNPLHNGGVQHLEVTWRPADGADRVTFQPGCDFSHLLHPVGWPNEMIHFLIDEWMHHKEAYYSLFIPVLVLSWPDVIFVENIIVAVSRNCIKNLRKSIKTQSCDHLFHFIWSSFRSPSHVYT